MISTKQVKKLAIMPLALTALLGASTIFSTETASADSYTYYIPSQTIYNNGYAIQTPSYNVSTTSPNDRFVFNSSYNYNSNYNFNYNISTNGYGGISYHYSW
ncbi:hypothetical protein IKE_05681 [Bacillus cereus VD196]|uniref:Uncharacterized protein n=1 Tax=Bacillus cereus VD196 TaxID=1053243 RepID=A0A9W5PYX7_BACCE|nr:hypothetical protein [Bacillus cereus]EJR90859.1 hypothetical protein IKG_05865 [Bacillus cereus VD200]EOO62452.1 hypothetical protein IKE_05681 [Bacillus cereus VD196]